MQAFKKILITSLIFFVIITSLLFAWSNRYAVFDWWQLRNYEPSDRIAAIVERTAMTSEGERLFYVADPQISDRETFNANCRVPEFTIILGCYIGHGKIYLYYIEDPRLDGILEVTAAHEMLHVAYERLGSSEREELDNLLLREFESIDNPRIIDSIAQYEQADPGIVPNELHSILGTEVANLSTELEEYYEKYFEDRQTVVSLSKQYESEFESRQSQVEAYDNKLENLGKRIEQNQTTLDVKYNDIQTMRSELDRLERNQEIEAYNQRVNQFNQKITRYNNLVQTIHQQIEEFNQIVKDRNNLTLEVQELVDAIDSRPESL